MRTDFDMHPSSGAPAASEEDPVASLQAPLRAAFVQAVERESASDAQRDGWVRELADRTDAALAQVDEMDPREAVVCFVVYRRPRFAGTHAVLRGAQAAATTNAQTSSPPTVD